MDLQAFGVKFDQYYLESSLYSGPCREDGRRADQGRHDLSRTARWLRTTDEGDDKDRVMRKSDGTHVLRAGRRVPRDEVGARLHEGDQHPGFGPPRHDRARAPAWGLHIGIPKGYPDYVLHKMVTVMRDGQEVKISKRAGSYVTVRDLIEWSGARRRPGSGAGPDRRSDHYARP